MKILKLQFTKKMNSYAIFSLIIPFIEIHLKSLLYFLIFNT